MITISRDPDDLSCVHRVARFVGHDALGPVTILIDEEEVESLIDLANLEDQGSDDIPEQVYADLERMASESPVVTTMNGRVIDLRPDLS
jgi:hypothetical protein